MNFNNRIERGVRHQDMAEGLKSLPRRRQPMESMMNSVTVDISARAADIESTRNPNLSLGKLGQLRLQCPENPIRSREAVHACIGG